ncbi:MAG: hypothetical protein WBG63_02455 [Phormidesmis sp.]
MNTLLPKNTHRLTLIAALTVAAMGTLVSAADAATYQLGFDQGVNGGSVLTTSNGLLDTTQWADWKLDNISGVNSRTGDAAKLNLYNTNENGRDNDLKTGSNWKTAPQGNALIIQEEDGNSLLNNGKYKADDEAKGGYIDFKFAEAVDFGSITLLDIDDNGGGIRIEGTRADGSLLNIDIDRLMAQHHRINGTNGGSAEGTSVSRDGVTMTQVGNRQGDNSMFRFDINDAFLTNVRVSYPGSGAIAGLEWDTLEAAAPQEVPEPSAIGGLLMIGFIGKKLKQKRDLSAVSELA